MRVANDPNGVGSEPQLPDLLPPPPPPLVLPPAGAPVSLPSPSTRSCLTTTVRWTDGHESDEEEEPAEPATSSTWRSSAQSRVQASRDSSCLASQSYVATQRRARSLGIRSDTSIWDPCSSFRLVQTPRTAGGPEEKQLTSPVANGGSIPERSEDTESTSITARKHELLAASDTYVDSDVQRGASKRSGFARISRRISFLVKDRLSRSSVPVYTSREFEQTIYDIQTNINTKGVLSDHGMIISDPEDNEDEVSYWWSGFTSKGRCLHFASTSACIADAVMLAVVVLSSCLSPLCFLCGGTWSKPENLPGGRWFFRADASLDVIYICYLLWCLNVSILHPTRHREVELCGKVFHWYATSLQYWASWVSTFPSLLIAWTDAPPLLNVVKVVRLVHLFYLPDSLWQWRDGKWVRLTRLIALLLFCSHWAACLLGHFGGYCEALQKEGFEYFETEFYGSRISGQLSMYFMVFVEAIHMLTGALDNPLGTGFVRENQFGSLIIVAFSTPIGCVIISLFISTVVSEQQKSCALSKRHEENMVLMLSALQTLNIPKGLQERVFALHRFRRMAHDRDAFEALFNGQNLSITLQSALRIYLYHDNVLCSGYFHGKDINYVLEIIRVLHDEVYLPGDYVLRRGEVGRHMYFLVRGKVSVLVPHPKDSSRNRISRAETIVTYEKGQYFGEVALVHNCVRTAWVRADNYVLLASLAQEDFERIRKHFPDECEDLILRATETVERDREREQNHRSCRDESWGTPSRTKTTIELSEGGDLIGCEEADTDIPANDTVVRSSRIDHESLVVPPSVPASMSIVGDLRASASAPRLRPSSASAVIMSPQCAVSQIPNKATEVAEVTYLRSSDRKEGRSAKSPMSHRRNFSLPAVAVAAMAAAAGQE